MSEGFLEHALGAGKVAHVAERVAQVGRKTNLVRCVLGAFLSHTSKAGFEEVDRALRLAERCVGLAERRVDVGPLGRGQETRINRGLQALGGCGIVSGSGLCEANRDPRAKRGGRVAGCDCVIEDLQDHVLGLAGIIGQPQLQLSICEPELAFVNVPKVRACLQVFDGDAELACELAKRLDRRTAGAGLDSRDVGVGNTGRGQFALGQLSLEPKSAQAFAY